MSSLILIAFGAIATIIVYKMRIPIANIIGQFVDEKYISNILGGIYFGTQVIEHVKTINLSCV